MKITITLNEKEIIDILRNHYTERGFDVYDWQFYDSRRDGVRADIRLNADDICVINQPEKESRDCAF